MGGLGSGRSGGLWRVTADSCKSLDINWLKRKRFLVPGKVGSVVWSRNGEQTGSVRVNGGSRRIELDYQFREGDGDWEQVSEWVEITWVPCTLGGSRPYFICPGVVDGVPCRRRVAKLYGADRFFACRYCYDLKYGSQSEPRWERMMRRARTLREKLGGEPMLGERLPLKPKGMWWRTYCRICAEIAELERNSMVGVLARLQRHRP